MTFDEAKLVLAALDRESVEYVLVGSMGMAAQGLIRATRDLDFFVRPTVENVDRLKCALKSVFKDAAVDEISAEDLAGDYPAVQYVPPDGDFWLDILARLGEAFRYDDLQWEEIIVEDIRVRVATPQTLYRMKKDTVRPQDRVDACWIRQTFELQDD